MKKNYKQELADLQSGLNSLNNIVKESKSRILFNKAKKNIPIQEARIDFFKRGYAFRDKELKQTKLIEDTLKLENIRGKKTPDYLFFRIKRSILNTIPDEFYMSLTINNVREFVKP